MVKPSKNYVCERCKKETPFIEPCDYCSRKICRSCEKAAATHSKILHTIICKSCWGDLRKRRKFKSL